MKLKMKILILIGSLMLLVFALNVGVASAHGPTDQAKANTFGPVLNSPAFTNAQGFARSVVKPNGDTAAILGIEHNPLCPRHTKPALNDVHPPGNP